MKALSKPLSSPGRTEKFPPPLMRFLRSNVGSRSRGRPKSSPMFFRRKNTGPGGIETTQEPSSPKVTCIGQVKIRRSSKSSSSSSKASGKPKRSNSCRRKLSKQTPCWWIRRVLCCNQFFPKCPKLKSPRRVLKRWAMFFRCRCCKKVDTSLTRDDSSSRIESIPRIHNNNSSTATSDVENSDFVACSSIIEAVAQAQEAKKEEFVTNPSTPPKNAFLLTRCRSAPYRSSSLASRFWGSPLRGEEEEEEENNANIGEEKCCKAEEAEEAEGDEEQGHVSSSPVCRNEVAEPRFSSQSEEMMDGSIINVINTSFRESKSIQDMRAVGGSAVHPLLLTRCKSEPARTGPRLLVNPDAISFCKQRRLDVSQNCSQQNDTPNCN